VVGDQAHNYTVDHVPTVDVAGRANSSLFGFPLSFLTAGTGTILAGHCKRLADTWKQLGAAYKGNKQVEIAHIDCTQARDVCSQADVSTKLAFQCAVLPPLYLLLWSPVCASPCSMHTSSNGSATFWASLQIKGYPTLKAVYKGEEYKPYR
jgi:thiol-disulfide isomerase/thioredoxin